MTLAELKIGQTATILSVGGEGGLRQHFLDMGVLPGVPITLVKYAPMGDPMELRVHGYELTLRRADARKIEVKEDPPPTPPQGRGVHTTNSWEQISTDNTYLSPPLRRGTGEGPTANRSFLPEPEHPGLGEGGHYHQEQEKARRETVNGKRKAENGKLLDKTFNVQRSTFNDTLLTFALVGNQNCGKTTLFN